jgi:hypothetical protein
MGHFLPQHGVRLGRCDTLLRHAVQRISAHSTVRYYGLVGAFQSSAGRSPDEVSSLPHCSLEVSRTPELFYCEEIVSKDPEM